MNDLKPCPFCGGKVDYVYDFGMEPYGVRCMTCRIVAKNMRHKPMTNKETFGDVQERIAEWWNRREHE